MLAKLAKLGHASSRVDLAGQIRNAKSQPWVKGGPQMRVNVSFNKRPM
jgi:hypothetical protein